MKKVNPNSFASLFDEAGVAQNIRRGLILIIIGNVFGTGCGYICTYNTTSMVGLATSIGADDLQLGILSAIGLAIAVFQIPFSLYVNEHHHRKAVQLVFGLLSKAFWMITGAIPFIFPMASKDLKVFALIMSVALAGTFGSAVSVCWYPWFSDLCPNNIKSRVLAKRESILNIIGPMFNICIGFLLDILPVETRYFIIFLIGGALGAIDMCCYIFIDEVYSAPPKHTPIKEVFADIRHNKRFVRFVMMWTGWALASSLTDSFIYKYMLTYLNFSNLQATIVNAIVPCIITILVVMRWGKAIHIFGCKNVLIVSGLFAGACRIPFFFCTPNNLVLSLICCATKSLFAAFWCGSCISCNYLQLSTSPDDMRPSYLAVYNVVIALVGSSLGAILAGIFLDTCVENNWFTGFFDRYKALFVIATLVHYGVCIPLIFSMPDDSNKTPKQLLKQMFTIPR